LRAPKRGLPMEELLEVAAVRDDGGCFAAS
jgi:hypothetical protein